MKKEGALVKHDSTLLLQNLFPVSVLYDFLFVSDDST